MDTRIYSYDASTPTEGLDVVRGQFKLARRYRDALVRLELRRRARVDVAMRRVAPGLAAVEAEIAALEARIEAARARVKAARARVKKRVVVPGAGDEIRAILDALHAARARRKTLRTEAFGGSSWKVEQAAINEWAGRKGRALRGAISRLGLYWGTYLVVEDAASKFRKGAPPKIRFLYRQRVAVQLQKGLDVASLLGCEDSRLRLDVSTVFLPGTRRPKKLGDATVSFRVGSCGRVPILARVPIHFHRPLPEGWSVKWAWLTQERIGSREVWRFQFVVSGESEPELRPGGAVGIDVGWRMIGDAPKTVSVDPSIISNGFGISRVPEPRSLRVAHWAGSDGRWGEISLPADWLARMDKVREIQGVRQKRFDVALGAISEWVRGRTDLPEWWPAPESLRAWRSPGRLSRLVRRWRAAIPAGAPPILPAALEWLGRERHLLDYEAGIRARLQRARTDLYRRFAAEMRRSYGRIFVERLTLTDFHELPKPEEPRLDGALKEHVRDACLSSLLGCLRESGAEEVAAGWTTRDCSYCGHENEWGSQKPLVLICGGCGAAWDQDRNAAPNILRRGLEAKDARERRRAAR